VKNARYLVTDWGAHFMVGTDSSGVAMALGPVLMTIAASSVQAMTNAAVFSAKSDDWVGLAAIGSVLVCALLGMVIVRRYTSAGPRDGA